MIEKRQLKKLYTMAKQGDEKAINIMLNLLQPRIRRNSYINGSFNEDCFQELSIRLFKGLKKFQYEEKNIFDYDISA